MEHGLKKKKYYIFTWDFGRYKKTVVHSETFLPDLYVQSGFIKFVGISRRVGSISGYSSFNFSFASIYIREATITGKPMVFTPEVENEFIREAVSQKLDGPLDSPSNEVWIDSTQTQTQTSPFQIGDSLRYTNYGYNNVLNLSDISTNDHDIHKYSIKSLRVNTMIVTKIYSNKGMCKILYQFQFTQRIIKMN